MCVRALAERVFVRTACWREGWREGGMLCVPPEREVSKRMISFLGGRAVPVPTEARGGAVAIPGVGVVGVGVVARYPPKGTQKSQK